MCHNVGNDILERSLNTNGRWVLLAHVQPHAHAHGHPLGHQRGIAVAKPPIFRNHKVTEFKGDVLHQMPAQWRHLTASRLAKLIPKREPNMTILAHFWL